MKKLYTTSDYKKRQNRKLKRIVLKNKRRNNKIYFAHSQYGHKYKKNIIREPILAPKDFRLIENTEECLLFFQKLRETKNHSKINYKKIAIISLKDITNIDYGTISILTAISDELKLKNKGAAAINFYLGSMANGTDSMPVTLNPMSELIITLNEFAITDYSLHRFLTVVNQSDTTVTKYEVDML